MDIAKLPPVASYAGAAPAAPGLAVGGHEGGAAAQSRPQPKTRADLEQFLADLQKVLSPLSRSLQFSIDDRSGRTIVRVIDRSTREVIRQIPSEEILALADRMDKIQGLLLSTTG
ncbi:MAG TPA: flagellar protein FlaG [Rhodocyclaceae bacterium]|nr:flagellar protein FlaG [Rhodocyclaceae bacterium]